MSRNAQIAQLKDLFVTTKPVDAVTEQPFTMKSFSLDRERRVVPLHCIGYNAEARTLVLADAGERFHYIGGVVEHYALLDNGDFIPLQICQNNRGAMVFIIAP